VAKSAPVEETACDELLHLALHRVAVEAEPEGAGDLIGGRAMRLLRHDDRQDLRRGARDDGRHGGYVRDHEAAYLSLWGQDMRGRISTLHTRSATIPWPSVGFGERRSGRGDPEAWHRVLVIVTDDGKNHSLKTRPVSKATYFRCDRGAYPPAA